MLNILYNNISNDRSVIFRDDSRGLYLVGTVSSGANGYFITFIHNSNDIIFNIYDLDKKRIINKYNIKADYSCLWPCCESREDLIKLLNAIEHEVNHSSSTSNISSIEDSNKVHIKRSKKLKLNFKL